MADLKEYEECIKNLTKEFSKIDPKWKCIIYSEKDEDKLLSLKNKLEDIYFSAIKQCVNNDTNIDEFNKIVIKIIGDKAFVGLNKQMKTMLNIFYDAHSISLCIDPAMFITECFDKMILRRDLDFIKNEWEILGFDSEIKMEDAINAISSIVWSHVNLALSKNIAKSEFKKITDLDDQLCLLYAEKYETCFDRLEIKMMLKNQRALNNKIDILIDVLSGDK